jgi:hypothetical protein
MDEHVTEAEDRRHVDGPLQPHLVSKSSEEIGEPSSTGRSSAGTSPEALRSRLITRWT